MPANPGSNERASGEECLCGCQCPWIGAYSHAAYLTGVKSHTQIRLSCADLPGRIAFTSMETISTIAQIAAITCCLALVALLWRGAERADEETKTLMQR
jgi:hypothetical protein